MNCIVEQAGGVSSTGYERIMEMTPENLHQRVPVILGSKNEVEVVQGHHQQVLMIEKERAAEAALLHSPAIGTGCGFMQSECR